jgi:hypothetical protein
LILVRPTGPTPSPGQFCSTTDTVEIVCLAQRWTNYRGQKNAPTLDAQGGVLFDFAASKIRLLVIDSVAVSAYLSTLMAMDTTLNTTRVPMGATLNTTRVAAFNSKERLSHITRERRHFESAWRRGHRGRIRNRFKAKEQRRSNRQS